MSRTSTDWRRTLAEHAGALVLTLLCLIGVTKLWRADLRIPFAYAGDGLMLAASVKAIIEDGWFLHNPRVGAPDGQDMEDFLGADTWHFFLIKLIGYCTRDAGTAVNLYYLFTFPLTTCCTLLVLRHFKIAYGPALLASLLFSFVPFHLIRIGHLFLASYYLIPLLSMVVLWICLHPSEEAAETRFPAPRLAAGILICLLGASAGVYYAAFALFFLTLAGVYALLHAQRQACFVALLMIATVVVGVFANLSPTFVYQFKHGKNALVASRVPMESELYGLKIVQLLLPIANHRLPSLRAIRESYNSFPLVTENSTATLGLVGSVGFLLLMGYALFWRSRNADSRLLEVLSLMTLAAVLLGTIGGFGTGFNLLVTPMIRCYNRISVYIAFFALFAVAWLLDRLVVRRAHSLRARLAAATLLAAVLLGGILDQTDGNWWQRYQGNAATHARDAEFVRLLEETVPEHAMIFQLPYIPFPEEPHPERMYSSDHFRVYLHSTTLRWSYGAMKGRTADLWQRTVTAKPLADMVEEVARAGFAGIYVDRFGYADSAAQLESSLRNLLGSVPITSSDQRWAFFALEHYKERHRSSPRGQPQVANALNLRRVDDVPPLLEGD